MIKYIEMPATLKYPVMGYTSIKLIIKRKHKWLAELVGADVEIEVSEDEFTLNDSAQNYIENEQITINKRQFAYLAANSF
jgi:hypothetical protein